MVCTSIGKTGPTGFWSQRIEDASVASSNENGTVVADGAGMRLLFINPSGELTGVYGLSDKETPVTTALRIHQVGTDVFVAGITRAEDGESIATEGVLKFNVNGELLGTVWKREYKDGTIQITPTISDITTDEEGNLILVQFDQQEIYTVHYSGTVTKLEKDGSGEQVLRKNVHPKDYLPFEILYDPKGDRCAMTDYYGQLFVERSDNGEALPVATDNRTLAIQTFDISGDMAVLYDQKSHALVRTDNLFDDSQLQLKDLDAATQCAGIKICGNTMTAILDDGAVRIYDLPSGSSVNLTEIPLIPSFAMRQIVLYLCTAYLVVLFVVLAIQWIIHSIKQGQHAKVRRVVVATAITLICAVAMVFHMANVYVTSALARQTNMAQIVSQASATSPTELGDAATNEAKRALGQLQGTDYVKDQLAVLLNIESILTSSFANSNGVQCTIYTVTDDGEVRYLFSNDRERDSVVLGSLSDDEIDEITSSVNAVIEAANKHEGEGSEKALRFAHDDGAQNIIRRNKAGQYVVSSFAPLFAKDGTCCTAIEVSCHAESLVYNILSNVLGILFVFLMTAVSICILSDEILRSGGVYLRYKRMQEDGVEWAEILLGRPLCFAINLAFTMDAAFAVIIAKDMLANSNLDSTAFVMCVPALAISMGSAVGTLLHAFMCSRVSGRSYALPTLLLGIASQLLCFFAVANSWFAAFVACKFISSASLATIQFVSKNRAGATHSKQFDDKRLPLLVKRSPVNIAGKGAAVVAGVVGGALAYLGSQWVYLAGALAGIAVIPLLLIALPKDKVISKHSDRANLHNAFEFLRSPIMLASLAFGILPVVLAGGYKSYILPLFLDSVGVTKTDISCLFAVGNAILYAFSDSLISFRDARGRWVMTWVGLICLGVLFVLFSYNQAPVWAMVSVVLITMLIWFAGDWKHNARAWAKIDYGFSYDQSQTLLNTEESVVKNVQGPVLTALLTLGASTCCLILGIYFAISGVCYYFPTRKRKDNA